LVIFNIVLIGLTTFGIIRIYPKKSKNPEIPDSDSPEIPSSDSTDSDSPEIPSSDSTDSDSPEIPDSDSTPNITVLRKDEDFIKPGIKLNLEFELVKLKNGMTGLIVKDPYAKFVHAQFQVENGFLTDTIAGLAHLDEHMIFDGSEKYKYYSYERTLSGTFGFSTNAFTSDMYQAYYVSSNKNNYTKAIDIMLDAFRHSLYDEEIIKKEIQAINSEFYTGYREWYFLLLGIIRQLSSKKTSFNGFGVGNNETLLPSESPALSKKLKQYHMVVNRPENIFFTFYSNLTMNESEEYIKNNFNYKMYEFPENEIDKEYKKALKRMLEN
jgi:secreted Zn-dependent insulinase-like peptidase